MLLLIATVNPLYPFWLTVSGSCVATVVSGESKTEVKIRIPCMIILILKSIILGQHTFLTICFVIPKKREAWAFN